MLSQGVSYNPVDSTDPPTQNTYPITLNVRDLGAGITVGRDKIFALREHMDSAYLLQ